jgi:hypothetical protein
MIQDNLYWSINKECNLINLKIVNKQVNSINPDEIILT